MLFEQDNYLKHLTNREKSRQKELRSRRADQAMQQGASLEVQGGMAACLAPVQAAEQ